MRGSVVLEKSHTLLDNTLTNLSALQHFLLKTLTSYVFGVFFMSFGTNYCDTCST